MVERPTALRPFWSGVLTFGLVAVPVELFAILKPRRATLRMIGPDGLPVHRRFICPAHDRPVEADELVRGVEVGDGTWVTVTDAELDALEPKRSREIDLERFVPRAALDPLWTDRPYLLLPDGEVSKAYRLLARVMEQTELAGLARFVMRGREQTIAVLAEGGVLHALTLRRPQSVRSAADVGLEGTLEAPKARVRSLRAAIDGLAAASLDLDELADHTAEAIRALAEAKSGDAVARSPEEDDDEADDDEEDPHPKGEVVDLMQILRERLGGAKPAPSAEAAKAKPAAKVKPAATKPAPKAKAGGEPADAEPEDLSSLTRAALYERAQAAEIPGRSAMDKDALIAALRG